MISYNYTVNMAQILRKVKIKLWINISLILVLLFFTDFFNWLEWQKDLYTILINTVGDVVQQQHPDEAEIRGSNLSSITQKNSWKLTGSLCKTDFYPKHKKQSGGSHSA